MVHALCLSLSPPTPPSSVNLTVNSDLRRRDRPHRLVLCQSTQLRAAYVYRPAQPTAYQPAGARLRRQEFLHVRHATVRRLQPEQWGCVQPGHVELCRGHLAVFDGVGDLEDGKGQGRGGCVDDFDDWVELDVGAERVVPPLRRAVRKGLTRWKKPRRQLGMMS
jgi:hypothetical protein